MTRLLIGFLLAALPALAQASTLVLGDGPARDCFLAARTQTYSDQAIKACDDALGGQALDDSDRAATFVNRGVLEADKGDQDLAMADYEAGMRLRPNFADAYGNHGAGLVAEGHFREALAEIDKAIALGLSYPQAGYFNRGLAEEGLGRFHDAYADFQQALKIDPGFAPALEQVRIFKGVSDGTVN